MEAIPVERLYHATVVVRDLRAMARSYAEVYGIEKWQVARHDEERLTDASAFGLVMPFSYVSATGANAHGVTFRLVQPLQGFSTFQEFLITRGQGIHGFCVATLSEAGLEELRRWLAEQGAGVGQCETVAGAATYCYFDMSKTLGNFYVQVILPRRDDWQAAVPVDEERDFSCQI